MPAISVMEHEKRLDATMWAITRGESHQRICASLSERFGVELDTVRKWIYEVGERWRARNHRRHEELVARAEMMWIRNYDRAIEMDDNVLLAKASEALCKIWGVYEQPSKNEKPTRSREEKEARIIAMADALRAKQLA